MLFPITPSGIHQQQGYVPDQMHETSENERNSHFIISTFFITCRICLVTSGQGDCSPTQVYLLVRFLSSSHHGWTRRDCASPLTSPGPSERDSREGLSFSSGLGFGLLVD